MKKYLMIGALALAMAAPVSAQDYRSQLGAITTALQADPTNPKAAQALVKAYTKEFKKNPEAMVALGNAYLLINNFSQANVYADMALKKNKNYGDAFILKGDAAAIQDDGGEAAMWYQQAMNLEPTNPKGYMKYASVNRKVSPAETERAIAELRRNCPNFPVDAEFGHTYYAAGDYQKAYDMYSKADNSQLNESRLVEKATTEFYLKDYEQGLATSKFGLQKFAGSPYFNRLALYNAVDANKFGEALGYAKALMSSDADKVSADYAYYGRALSGNGQYQEAVEQLEKAVSMDEKNYRHLTHLADAHMGLGNEDKALEYKQAYLSNDANAKMTDWMSLVQIYLGKVDRGENKSENFQKAMGVYDTLAAKYPQIASWAHLQQGDMGFKYDVNDYAASKYKEVIAELESKADRDSDETGYLKTALRNLGYHMWSNDNDLEGAKPYFQKLYDLDPTDSLAKRALGIE